MRHFREYFPFCLDMHLLLLLSDILLLQNFHGEDAPRLFLFDQDDLGIGPLANDVDQREVVDGYFFVHCSKKIIVYDIINFD